MVIIIGNVPVVDIGVLFGYLYVYIYFENKNNFADKQYSNKSKIIQYLVEPKNNCRKEIYEKATKVKQGFID